MTEVQEKVVNARIKDGYEIIGKFTNLVGLAGCDIGMIKGKHRIHVNVLGYDCYLKGINYLEVK